MIDLTHNGLNDPISHPDHLIPARITAVHKERFAIVCIHGEGHARIKTSEFLHPSACYPTVGDFVLVGHNPSGDSLIYKTLPRRTYFSRRDPSPGRGEQAVAANFDYVFIMQSCNMDINARRLERYLTLAWQSGAQPVVLLTKADLVPDPAPYLTALESAATGVPVHVVSAHTGDGLSALIPYLQPGNTIVFLGSSGVGKSSLVNALMQKDVMAVRGIREDDSKGRHTTTHRQLLMLPCGAMLIDTPGMRELGMWDVSEGLGDAFADVEAFAIRCRFRNCTHQSEPGCAVRAAITEGLLAPERWQSYCNLRREAKYADDKQAFLREKQQWHKSIRKEQKRIKKGGWNE